MSNIVKEICIETGLTYKELGEEVGFGEGAIKNAAASGKISKQLNKALEMFIRIRKLEAELAASREVKKIINTWVNM